MLHLAAVGLSGCDDPESLWAGRVPAQRVGDIVAGKRAVTAEAELRFCHCFGSNPRPEVTQPQLHCLDLGARGVSEALARWRHER
jgi:hypothetical protein